MLLFSNEPLHLPPIGQLLVLYSLIMPSLHSASAFRLLFLFFQIQFIRSAVFLHDQLSGYCKYFVFLFFLFFKEGLLQSVTDLDRIRKLLVHETNRRTEFQFYWYYDSTCFGQPFCPSSGVLSRTSALVHFMQL